MTISLFNIKKPSISPASVVAKTIRLSRGIRLRPDLVPASLVYFYAVVYALLSPSLSLFSLVAITGTMKLRRHRVL